MTLKENLQNRLGSYRTHPLSLLPTPVHKMENLSAVTGGKVNVFIKRDDLTGMAMGGNKNRKLDYIMTDIIEKKADTIITWGGLQSNWCRQVAAAAKIHGIQAKLILFRKPGKQAEKKGNLLLDYLLDADVRIIESSQNQKLMTYRDVKTCVDPVLDDVKRAGGSPYLISIGGSSVEGSMTAPLGSIAYINGFLEIIKQFSQMGKSPDTIVLATGSGGTQAGLLGGKIFLESACRILGITVSEKKTWMVDCIKKITEHSLADLNGTKARVAAKDLIVMDEYLGAGYGVVTPEINRTIRLIAETEGILLDPVYTGKAMTGLLDLIQKDHFSQGDNIVFWHTGGLPALFA